MAELRHESFYNLMDPILEDINKKCMRLNPEHKKMCLRRAHLVTGALVRDMKEENSDFKELFNRIDFVGSYYEGLKVHEPTSFNMNIIMKLFFKKNLIQIEEDEHNAGFVKLNCRNAQMPITWPSGSVEKTSAWKLCNSWVNKEGYLVENKPRQWLESVLVKTIQSYRFDIIEIGDEHFTIELKKCGPSYIVRIFGEFVIDIVLAFTIEFPSDMHPPQFRRHEEYSYPWVVVSDTVKKYLYGRTDELWRISFPGLEKRLLHDKQKLKYIFRFLKAFRDAQTNIVISSYLIKNLFLREMLEIEEGRKERFWEKRTGYLYVYMMFKLYSALDDEELEYYWCPEVDMLRYHNVEHKFNMKNQLKNIINKINRLIEMNRYYDLTDYIFSLYKQEE